MSLSAPIPSDELERLIEVRSLAARSAEREERFDRLSRLACEAFNVPVAMLAWMDEDTQIIKSVCGFDATEAPRNISFCGHTIEARGPMVVSDTHKDPRFDDNPWVVNAPHVRFYAGYPVLGPVNGKIVGTVCLYDMSPRAFTTTQINLLRDLACVAEDYLCSDWQAEQMRRAQNGGED